jgi:hypothetical protein
MSVNNDKRAVDAVVCELAELPTFPLPQLNADEAAKRLARATRGFVHRTILHIEAQRWKTSRATTLIEEASADTTTLSDAEQRITKFRLRRRAASEAKKRFGKALNPPRYQLAGAAGLGKTQGVVREYRANPALWGYQLEFYVPTIELGRALLTSFNTDAPASMPKAVLLPGRTNGDQSMPPPCERANIVSEVQRRVPNVYKAMCKSADGETCLFYGTCRYIQDRADRAPRVRIMAHAAMTTPQIGELALPDPDLVIVDESCIQPFLRIAKVDLEEFSLFETYYRAGGSDDVNACAEAHASLGGDVAQLLAQPGYLAALHERNGRELYELGSAGFDSLRQSNPNHLVNRLRAAAMAARRPLASLSICPNDTDEEVKSKLAGVPDHISTGVAAALSRIADDLDQGRMQSIGVTVCLENKEETSSMNFRPHVVVHGLKKRNFSNKVPLLLLDADAIPAVNKRLFGDNKQAPLRAIAIRARRCVNVVQCSSSVFSKRGFGINGHRYSRRGSELAARIGKLATVRAQAGPVLTVANKPVRRLLTGENGDKLAISGLLNENLPVTHFGAYTGQDIWKQFQTIVIVGREQPPAAALEAMARCIHADANTPLALTGSYAQARRHYGPADPRSAIIDYHPEPRVQQLLELVRERLSVQAVDRLRLVHRKKAATAIILCSVPLPGLIPDKLAPASRILDGGSKFERALGWGGFLTSNPRVLAACYPELWPTRKGAEQDIAKGYPETPDLLKETLIYADSGFLITAQYRIAPSRKWSKFMFDAGRCQKPQEVIAKAAEVNCAMVEFRGEMKWQMFVELQQGQKATSRVRLPSPAACPPPASLCQSALA